MYMERQMGTIIKIQNISKTQKSLGLFVIVSTVCFLVYFNEYRVSEIELKPCKLMTLNPWDESLKPFMKNEPPIICSNREQLMFVDKGFLRFNETVMEKYQIDTRFVKCFYSNLKRNGGDKDVIFEDEVKFVAPIFIKSHVFRVRCVDVNDNEFYDYLHFNPVWNNDAKMADDVENESESKLSVIIVGIDSVSRSHAIRNLPKSYRFLLEEFHAYDFEGYSKVGENTGPNIFPLLTGQSNRNFPFVLHLRKHADALPLLWNEKVVKNNFATFFAEDGNDIAVFSGTGKSGFKDQPTDFYFRPFGLGTRKFEPMIIDLLGKASEFCYGTDNYLELEIEYMKGFLMRYQSKRKYAFIWNNQASHESFTTLQHEDNRLLEFLKWMQYTNQTKNAILILLSDHGYRTGGSSLTHIGRAENNKPWLMVHVPEYLKRKYSWIHETMLQNTKRLLSIYDIYQTTFDLVHDVAFTKQKNASMIGNIIRRNIFYEIPRERTCLDAGIEKRYCMCDDKMPVSTDNGFIYSLAKFLVNEINNILSKYQSECNILSLHNVTEASVTYSMSDKDTFGRIPNAPKGILNKLLSNFKTKQDQTGRYFILFHTNHGNALFEGTVDYAEFGPKGIKNEMTMIEEPFRLDRYGNQSYCVEDSFLKPFCYCKNFKQHL
ncbi:uncharacterized protein LOC132716067 [Ruditapes philippinarum]|uniref:uncharacterized protein LOC132716067 n=1 Tax=Ruditapes philippinarum TaxID=129788 RepID=UPI00295C1FF1|nr:uncharacterized protein LOC132716067 [Ruditapes philippinarum]